MSSFNAWERVAESRLQTLPKFEPTQDKLANRNKLREALHLSHRKGIVSFDEFQELRNDLRNIPKLDRRTQELALKEKPVDKDVLFRGRKTGNLAEQRDRDILDSEFRTQQAERVIHNRLVASSYGRYSMFGTSWNQQRAMVAKGLLTTGQFLGLDVTERDKVDILHREAKTYDPWSHAAQQVAENMGHEPMFTQAAELIKRPGALGRTVLQGASISAPAFVAGAAAFYGGAAAGLSAAGALAIASAAGMTAGGATEFIMAIPEAMENAGVDWLDSQAVAEALKDPDKHNEILLTAARKAGPIALADLASIGALRLPVAMTRGFTNRTAKWGTKFAMQTGVQATAEGGGELLGQAWAFNKWNWDEAAIEALAGAGMGAPATVAGDLIDKFYPKDGQGISRPDSLAAARPAPTAGKQVEARAKVEAASAIMDIAESAKEANEIPAMVDRIMEISENSGGADPKSHANEVSRNIRNWVKEDPTRSHILVSPDEVGRQAEAGNTSLLAASGLSTQELQEHANDHTPVLIGVDKIPGNRRLAESIKEAKDHVKLSHGGHTLQEARDEIKYVRARTKATNLKDSEIYQRETEVQKVTGDLEGVGFNNEDSRNMAQTMVDVWYAVTESVGDVPGAKTIFNIMGPSNVDKDDFLIYRDESLYSALYSVMGMKAVSNILRNAKSTPQELAAAKKKLDQHNLIVDTLTPSFTDKMQDLIRGGIEERIKGDFNTPLSRLEFSAILYRGRMLRALENATQEQKDKAKEIFDGFEGSVDDWVKFLEDTKDIDAKAQELFKAVGVDEAIHVNTSKESLPLSAGGFNRDGSNNIFISTAADVETVLHEFGHFVSQAINIAQKEGKLSPELSKALDDLNKKLPGDTTAREEKFTDEFTSYLFTGKAKDPVLKQLFISMARILARLMFKQIPNMSVSKEGQIFFDMLLAADDVARKKFHSKLPAIRSAREARSFGLKEDEIKTLMNDQEKERNELFDEALHGKENKKVDGKVDVEGALSKLKAKIKSRLAVEASTALKPDTAMGRWKNVATMKEEFESGNWYIVSVFNDREDSIEDEEGNVTQGSLLEHPGGVSRHQTNLMRYDEGKNKLMALYGGTRVSEVQLWNRAEGEDHDTGKAFLVVGQDPQELFKEQVDFKNIITKDGWFEKTGETLSQITEMGEGKPTFGEGADKSGYWFQIEAGSDFSMGDTAKEGAELPHSRAEPGYLEPEDGEDGLLFQKIAEPEITEAQRELASVREAEQLDIDARRYVSNQTVQSILVRGEGANNDGGSHFTRQIKDYRDRAAEASMNNDLDTAVDLMKRAERFEIIDIYMQEAYENITENLEQWNEWRDGVTWASNELQKAKTSVDTRYESLAYKLLVWHGYLKSPDPATMSTIGEATSPTGEIQARSISERVRKEIAEIEAQNVEREARGEKPLPLPEDPSQSTAPGSRLAGKTPIEAAEVKMGDFMDPRADVESMLNRGIPMNTTLLPRRKMSKSNPDGTNVYNPLLKPGIYKDFENLAEFIKQLQFQEKQTRSITRGEWLKKRNELVDSIVQKAKPERQPTTRMWEGVRDTFHFVSAWLRIPEHLFFAMDGFQSGGAMWTAVFKPLSDAQNANNEMLFNLRDRLEGILVKMEKTDLWKNFSLIDSTKRLAGAKRNIGGRMTTADEIFMIALNSGTETGRRVMLNGARKHEGMDAKYIIAVLELLKENEWEVISELWDFMAELETQHEAVQKKFFGAKTPRWDPVRMSYVTTDGKDVSFVGRAFPIITQSEDVNPATANAVEKMRGFWNINTSNRDHAGAPEKIDLTIDGGLFRAIQAKVHAITHTEAKMRVSRLLDHRYGIRQEIENRYSKHHLDMIDDWFIKVTEAPREPLDVLNAGLKRVRTTAATAIMALNFRSAGQQFLGMITGAELVGYRIMARGTAYMLKDPIQAHKWMLENSVYMKHRTTTAHRDLADKLQGLRRPTKDKWIKLAWWQTRFFDMMASSTVWYGVYNDEVSKGIGHDEAIERADSAVRLTQASARQTDLSRVTSGNQLARLLTMFIGPLIAIHNLHANALLKNSGKPWTRQEYQQYFGSTVMKLFVFPSAVVATVFNDPGEDEEEWKHYLYTIMQSTVDPFPLVRDLSTSFSGRGTGISPVPFDYITDGVRNLLSVYEDVEAGDQNWVTVYQLIETLFYIVGGPAVTGGRFQRAIEGYDENDYTGREAVGHATGFRGLARLPEKIEDFADDIGF